MTTSCTQNFHNCNPKTVVVIKQYLRPMRVALNAFNKSSYRSCSQSTTVQYFKFLIRPRAKPQFQHVQCNVQRALLLVECITNRSQLHWNYCTTRCQDVSNAHPARLTSLLQGWMLVCMMPVIVALNELGTLVVVPTGTSRRVQPGRQAWCMHAIMHANHQLM